MQKLFLILFIFTLMSESNAQTGELPFREIPEAPATYTPGTVVSRMIDGLGFRYYWATEGLKDTDLDYKVSTEARTTSQTMDHIFSLSEVILSSAKKEVFEGSSIDSMSLDQKRAQTLRNLEMASRIFSEAEDLSVYRVEFKGKPENRIFPLWNQINGPISDAIWHCGQIVQNRRASGNPFNSKVSLFTGKLRS